jgi:DHA2 family multidrug resistance protein-like MFS transporter
LQRDLGGALMQSIFGALLAMGFAAAMGSQVTASPDSAQVTASVTSQLEMSYASAATIAAEYPQYSTQIIAAAKASFLAGDQYAYIAGIIAILIGMVLVFLKYPKKEEEGKKLAEFHTQDMAAMAAAAPKAAPVTATANVSK